MVHFGPVIEFIYGIPAPETFGQEKEAAVVGNSNRRFQLGITQLVSPGQPQPIPADLQRTDGF